MTFTPSIIRERTSTKFQEVYQVGSSTHLEVPTSMKTIELCFGERERELSSKEFFTINLYFNNKLIKSTFRTNSFSHTDNGILIFFNHFNNNT